MNRTEYLQLAAKTCPKLHGELIDRVHMIMGMVDEEYEYFEEIENNGLSDREKVIKENGDRWWYFANLCRMTGNEDIFTNENPGESDSSTIISIKLLGLYKKELAYGKTPDPTLVKEILHKINQFYTDSTIMMDMSVEEVLERNIQKLSNRFPDLKFDSKLAINKNEDNE